MAYGTLGLDTLQSSTTGTPTQFVDGSGTQIGTLCRAWVNFNGSTAAIRASFNVSSVTRNSAGNYTMNFTTALNDTNYSLSGMTDNSNGTSPTFVCLLNGGTATTSAIQFTTSSIAANVDNTRVNVSVFR